MPYAEVIIDVAHSEVDKIFEYACGEEVQAGQRVAVPFGKGVTAGFVIRTKAESDYPAEKIKPILQAEEVALGEESLFLAQKIARRYRVPLALSLRLFLPSELRKGKVKESTRTVYTLTDVPFTPSPRAPKQAELYAYLRNVGEEDGAALRKKFGTALASLEKAGAVKAEKRRVFRKPYESVSGSVPEHTLTHAQEEAVAKIRATDKTVTLLHGVTGSGKTEIYLTLIKEQLQAGKTAIFLVPEISLTPQTFKQLRARFGSEVAILHSGLSAGERYDEWRRLKDGEARVAVGARSAVFAPVENIGIIVIDEEHDGSYVSESAPRYDTFSIASLRAKRNGCKIVLGSATPSVETYRRARSGEFELVTLPGRVNARPMPSVTLVDMRREVRRGNATPFSAALRDKLSACLESGNQAIIFLNRRGYAQSVSCRDCGSALRCEHCDVALTFHREENCLKCHYCGAKYRMPSVCPTCGSTMLGYTGTGTQRVVRELQSLYPQARLLRMDVDTTGGKEGHLRILRRFAAREADILVGTQMVAKGHDFPSVTLVGVLDADMSLHFPDYRSGERTFQLVTQVAGRSGRAEARGEVVVQTYEPDNYILRFASQYDYEGFYDYEIALRAAAMFPPFAKIVRVMVTGEDEKETVEALRDVYGRLREVYEANGEKFLFFNRMHAPVKRIQNKYRYQVLMRMTEDGPLKEIYDAADEVKRKGVLCYVEEDPANLN